MIDPDLLRQRQTAITRAWLERRYQHCDEEGIFSPHEPIYGFGVRPSEPGHARRLCRIYDLMLEAASCGGETLLDIGGAEGYFAELCRGFLGFEAMSADLSHEACRRAAELFEIPAAAVNASSLPFADDSFDVVVMAEVAEHLTDPVHALLEASRVAKRFLIVSTEEWHEDEALRRHILAGRSFENHMERNVYAPSDLEALFAPHEVSRRPQRFIDRLGADVAGEAISSEALIELLLGADVERCGGGAILRVAVGGVAPEPRLPNRRELAEKLLAATRPPHRLPASTPHIPMRPGLVDRCPRCGQRGVAVDEDGVDCFACESRFERREGVFDFHAQPRSGFSVRLDDALRGRGGEAYDGQRAGLQAIEEAFTLLPDTGASWTFSDGPAPWASHGVDSSEATWRAEHQDPQLISPWLGLPIANLEAIVVELGVDWNDELPPELALGELFFWVDGDDTFSQEKSLAFPLDRSVSSQEYRLEIPQSLRAFEHLVRLRVDPVAAPVPFRVKRVELFEGA